MEWKRIKTKKKIKPCPCCGNEDVFLFEPDDWKGTAKVRCTNISCGLETGLFACEGKRAIDIWNRMPRRCPICATPTSCYDIACPNCKIAIPWGKLEVDA